MRYFKTRNGKRAGWTEFKTCKNFKGKFVDNIVPCNYANEGVVYYESAEKDDERVLLVRTCDQEELKTSLFKNMTEMWDWVNQVTNAEDRISNHAQVVYDICNNSRMMTQAELISLI